MSDTEGYPVPWARYWRWKLRWWLYLPLRGWLWRRKLGRELWCWLHRRGLINRCHDCRGSTWGEYYSVHRHIWAAGGLAVDGGLLCIGCLEARLGRQLHCGDFTDAPINDPCCRYPRFPHSPRLADRLTRQPPDA